MFKIAICDDDVNTIHTLHNVLVKICKNRSIDFEIEIFSSGETLLTHIQKNYIGYDLIFLDIKMDNINGIEVAREIRKFDEYVYLIYVTNYENYALEAYEVYPYQFLVKPFSFDILEKHLIKIYSKLSSEDIFYEYKSKRSYYRIPIRDIMYFESNKRIISIYLVDGNVYTYYDKLNTIEEKISNTKAMFWRIHQSILVNSRYIKCKSYDHVELLSGRVFYISEDRRKNINAQYVKLVEDEFIES